MVLIFELLVILNDFIDIFIGGWVKRDLTNRFLLYIIIIIKNMLKDTLIFFHIILILFHSFICTLLAIIIIKTKIKRRIYWIYLLLWFWLLWGILNVWINVLIVLVAFVFILKLILIGYLLFLFLFICICWIC
jgi:hypothetical protein